MAIKRCFGVKNAKDRICLSCGAPLPLEAMKDDTICTCEKCGQQMTVDRYGASVTLTVLERADIRRRIPREIRQAQTGEALRLHLLSEENAKLKEKLARTESERKSWERKARDYKRKADEQKKEAHSWQQAADGLARMVEEMKAKEGAPGV